MAGASGRRRYLVTKTDDLAKLTQMYRQRLPPEQRINLPVLDGRSSQLVLASSSLLSTERNSNGLGKWVLSTRPRVQHPIEVNLDDKLEMFGYDIVDDAGRFVDSVAPSRKYHIRTYYQVLDSPITTDWGAFVHVDGYHRRHNGDHKPLNGKYPISLWLKGDIVVDDYEFALEPNFGAGVYTLYFGLWYGCDGPECRLKVKSGPTDGLHRINGGPLRVQ
jgi:hypothetical protein